MSLRKKASTRQRFGCSGSAGSWQAIKWPTGV